MKKYYYLLVFIVLFVGMLFLIRQDLINEYNYAQIKKDPAQTMATDRKLITSGSGDFKGFRVDFYYTVDGQDYNFRSLDTTKKISNAYLTDDKYKSIIYAKQSPQRAMLQYHYDLWQQKKRNMATIMIGFSLFVSLLLTLILALVMFLRKRIRNKKPLGETK